MARQGFWQAFACIVTMLMGGALVGGVAHAADDAQAILDKATDIKLAAESVADLNEVIQLCQQALKGGLDEGNIKFANTLLASTL